MAMNTNATRGNKIVFSNPLSGRLLDQREARKHLKVNGVYTVERTAQNNWGKKVYLLEFPELAFNTALFDDAK